MLFAGSGGPPSGTSQLGSAIGYDTETREITWKVVFGGLIGLMAVGARQGRLLGRDEEIALVDALVDHGAGSLLLLHAKAHGPGVLELWCFQANDKARRFYERHGFTPVAFTNGQRNEEKTPDVRYRWIRPRELTHSQS